MIKPKITRFVVLKELEDIPASYNCQFGEKTAERWALLNAKQRRYCDDTQSFQLRSKILAEYSDGTTSVYRDFSAS